MRLLIKILIVSVLSYYGQMLFPWWIVVIAPGLVSLFLHSKSSSSFVSGFLGVGLVWFVLAWYTHEKTEGVLSEKIASLFSLSDAIHLIVLTGLVGGLAGGLGALTGTQLRLFLLAKRRTRSPFDLR